MAALRDAERFDVIFLNRDLIPEMRVRWLEPWLARRNPAVIFDFDDAIYLGSRDAKLRQILPCFAAVTAGNETLGAYAREWNSRVRVLPTVVDTGYYQPPEQRQPGPLRIGWTGSAAPLRDYLPLVETPIRSLASRRDFEFVVISSQPPHFAWPGVKLRFIRWNPATEAEDLQQIDIGLMPLRDGPFEAAKCGTKAILHMAAGVPAVVSPAGVNRDIVVHGETGFHCRTEAEWYKALETLLQDPALRQRMGRAGRDRAVHLYSQQRALPKLLALFDEVAGWRHLLTSQRAEQAAPPVFPQTTA
jgi:glycosyltransferase involved in cell wall biosynthesis